MDAPIQLDGNDLIALVDFIPSPLLVTDEALRVLYANPAAVTHLGKSAEALAQSPMWSLAEPPSAHLFAGATFTQVLGEGISERSCGRYLLDAEGVPHPTARLSRIRFGDHPALLWVLRSQDGAASAPPPQPPARNPSASHAYLMGCINLDGDNLLRLAEDSARAFWPTVPEDVAHEDWHPYWWIRSLRRFFLFSWAGWEPHLPTAELLRRLGPTHFFDYIRDRDNALLKEVAPDAPRAKTPCAFLLMLLFEAVDWFLNQRPDVEKLSLRADRAESPAPAPDAATDGQARVYLRLRIEGTPGSSEAVEAMLVRGSVVQPEPQSGRLASLFARVHREGGYLRILGDPDRPQGVELYLPALGGDDEP